MQIERTNFLVTKQAQVGATLKLVKCEDGTFILAFVLEDGSVQDTPVTNRDANEYIQKEGLVGHRTIYGPDGKFRISKENA
jgi:hypothetical protein